MAETAESFRQSIRYYQNARDWANKHRDQAIRRANERAVGSQARTLTVDASFG